MPHRLNSHDGWLDIISQMPAFLVIFGTEREVLWVNRLAFGYRAEDVLGVRTEGGVHPEDRPRWVHCMQCCLDLGETHSGTARLLESGKTIAWRMAPLRNGKEIVGCLMVSWDVTLEASRHATPGGTEELVPAGFLLGPTGKAVVGLLQERGPLSAKEIARGVGETTGESAGPSNRLRVLLADLEARGVLGRKGGDYQIAREFLPHLPAVK